MNSPRDQEIVSWWGGGETNFSSFQIIIFVDFLNLASCFVDFLNFDSNCVRTKIVGLLEFNFHCECR